MDGSRLLLIDATGLLVRSERAARGKARSDELALFFFARSVIRFINYHDPDYVVAAWDGPGSLDWRRERFPAYKANRPASSLASLGFSRDLRDIDEEIVLSLWYHASHFLVAAGITSIGDAPFEADDIISWCTHAGSREGIWNQFIRSDDADMNQLVTDELRKQYPLHGDEPVIDADFVRAKYGCDPRDLPSVRALSGDSSDNIPGLKGIGPKSACKLLEAAHWKLADVDHPDAARAVVFEEIMSLLARQDAVYDWLHALRREPFRIRQRCAWEPAAHSAELGWFFLNHEMNSLLKASQDGSLWTG